jgi:hypothetical protein
LPHERGRPGPAAEPARRAAGNGRTPQRSDAPSPGCTYAGAPFPRLGAVARHGKLLFLVGGLTKVGKRLAWYSGTPQTEVYRMPTVNPRVNVTLSPSLDSLVARMAALQRVSKSQVLRELLEAAEPALQRAAALMEAASKAHAGVLGELARGLERAQAKAEADLSDSLERMDRVTADLVTVAQTVRGRRPRTGAAPASEVVPVPRKVAEAPPDPPASKRGVKSPRRGVL